MRGPRCSHFDGSQNTQEPPPPTDDPRHRRSGTITGTSQTAPHSRSRGLGRGWRGSMEADATPGVDEGSRKRPGEADGPPAKRPKAGTWNVSSPTPAVETWPSGPEETAQTPPPPAFEEVTLPEGKYDSWFYTDETLQNLLAGYIDPVPAAAATFPDIPEDLKPAAFVSSARDGEVRRRLNVPGGDQEALFNVFETPADAAVKEEGGGAEAEPDAAADAESAQGLKEKVYRQDREYVKRHSAKKMIWFLGKVGLRHPAAIRTHLERVKHPEFELPRLQCVCPHTGNTVTVDEVPETEGGGGGGAVAAGVGGRPVPKGTGRTGRNNRNEPVTNTQYYQLYCATAKLVERVKAVLGRPKDDDCDYNKRVLTHIADIVGRLLWHSNRVHTVMFAKAEHLDRDCFILFGRQAEPAPYMMRSDSFFCRRHDSEKYKNLAPLPDLTRTNTSRVANESSVYVVGCDPFEMWETFPYEYRVTGRRPMCSLYRHIKQIDPSVLDATFKALSTYVNGHREQSPYANVASRTSCDVISVMLRDGGGGGTAANAADDGPAYKQYLENFVTLVVLNVEAIKWYTLTPHLVRGGHAPPPPLGRVVLHYVGYRREVRELRTDRVYYFRNATGFLCSYTLLDHRFDDTTVTSGLGEDGVWNGEAVDFYDIVNSSELLHDMTVNDVALTSWVEATGMIHESSHTAGRRLTDAVVKGEELPYDPFYPTTWMSTLDLAVDRVLEQSIVHSKKARLPSKRENGEVDREAVARALSSVGEDRLSERFRSPTKLFNGPIHSTEYGGRTLNYQVTVGATEEEKAVDYGPVPNVQVRLDCLTAVYLVDPNHGQQVRVFPGSCLTDRSQPDYVELNARDRILRVFNVQGVPDEPSSYTLLPYIYIVFRNTPVYYETEDLLSRMRAAMERYESLTKGAVSEMPPHHLGESSHPTELYDSPLERQGLVDFLQGLLSRPDSGNRPPSINGYSLNPTPGGLGEHRRPRTRLQEHGAWC